MDTFLAYGHTYTGYGKLIKLWRQSLIFVGIYAYTNQAGARQRLLSTCMMWNHASHLKRRGRSRDEVRPAASLPFKYWVGESLLLKLRHKHQITKEWMCMYTSGNNGWNAFDPRKNRLRNLPHASVHPNFNLSNKESLAAGTHPLWFGQEAAQFAC